MFTTARFSSHALSGRPMKLYQSFVQFAIGRLNKIQFFSDGLPGGRFSLENRSHSDLRIATDIPNFPALISPRSMYLRTVCSEYCRYSAASLIVSSLSFFTEIDITMPQIVVEIGTIINTKKAATV